MSTGWICPKCGRVYAPFMCECTHCNNKEIKPDPCIITSPWSQDYSKYKSEVSTDPCKCDQGVTIDDERLKYTTSRDFNSEYLTYTTTTTQNLKLDKDPMLFSQMICDSQGSREVDLLGRPITPINGVLETLMSPEQLRELAERIPARDEDARESSFEVMLEDDIQTELDNTLLYKCSACGKTYSGSTPIQCECGRKHGWIVLSSALQDDVNEALELHGRLKLGDSEAPDWADSKDKYILKINYDRDGVTQPSVNCSNAKWECPKCGNQFYEFPYKGCFCGAKGEELLQIAE